MTRGGSTAISSEWLQTQLHFISKVMDIFCPLLLLRLAPSTVKSCYLSPLCPCLPIRERMPRWKRSSLAGTRDTKWEGRWLSLPKQGRIHWACGKGSAQHQGLHSLPGSRHRGVISQACSIQCHQCRQQTPSSTFTNTHKPEPAFCGITEWFGLKATLKIILLQPPAVYRNNFH